MILVERPANLVRTRALKQLRLQSNVEAGFRAEDVRRDERRMVHMRHHTLARSFEFRQRRQFHKPYAPPALRGVVFFFPAPRLSTLPLGVLSPSGLRALLI